MVVASSDRNMTAKVVTELLFICCVFEIHVNNIKDFQPCQIIDAKGVRISFNDAFTNYIGEMCRSYTNSRCSLLFLFTICHFRILKVSLITDNLFYYGVYERCSR